MNWKACIAAGIIGTSAMTVFSYAVSKWRKKNFKEPELLCSLIQAWNPSLKKLSSQLLGWQAHYTMGIVWTVLFTLMKNENKHHLTSSVLFGAFGGATGAFIWKKTFDFNPDPPEIDYKEFYLQLLFAHLVFSFTMSKSYSALARLQ